MFKIVMHLSISIVEEGYVREELCKAGVLGTLTFVGIFSLITVVGC